MVQPTPPMAQPTHSKFAFFTLGMSRGEGLGGGVSRGGGQRCDCQKHISTNKLLNRKRLSKMSH